MKLVTILAEVDGEKCMNLDRYSTRLLALARKARFSSISTTNVFNRKRLEMFMSYFLFIMQHI